LSKIIEFSPEYTYFGCSAMEVAVETGVLRGRPWGGVGILIKNKFSKFIRFHKSGDCFSIIVLHKMIFISIYLPSR